MRLYLHGCLITLLFLFFCTDAFAAPPPAAFDGWTVDSATTTPIAQTILKAPSSGGFLQRQVDATETDYIKTIISGPALPPAIIAGNVTDAITNNAISGISISIFDANGNLNQTVLSDALGAYSSSELSSGDYYVKTEVFDHYPSKLHSYRSCIPNCDVTTGDVVTIMDNTAIGPIDFSLKQGGLISGVVTDIDSGEPLGNIVIRILSDKGNGTAILTNINGRYVSNVALPSGPYFVSTSSNIGYIDLRYNGEPCVGACDVFDDNPVTVTAPDTITGINFSLKKGGQISGLITDAGSGEPLNNISLSIYDSTGFFITNARTDSTGSYISTQGLPTDLYYMHTRNGNGYRNERYDGQACIDYDCDPTSGAAISVTQGEITTNINFSLALGGRISGTITDAITGQTPEYITVNIFNADGTLIDSIGTSSGQYTSSTGLPTGSYYAHTDNQHGYINERYSDQPLAGSGGITNATPIQVTAPEISNGIDFSLENGSRISGSITVSPTDSSFNNAYLGIEIFDSDGDPVSIAFPDSNGDFLSGAALPPGNYYVLAYDTQNKLASKLYGDVIFNGSCAAWQRCDVTMGAPVTVTQDNDSSNINFSLSLKINNDPDSDTDNSDLIDDVNSNTSGLENGGQENNGDANGGPASLSAPLLAVLALALLAINTQRWRRHSRFFVSI